MDNENHSYDELILYDNDYFLQLINEINLAQKSIDLEVYIFADDDIGTQVANSLCNAAQKGVSVRVIVDGVGTPGWGNPLSQKMMRAGIKTRVYHPLPWIFSHWKLSSHFHSNFLDKFFYFIININSRNHRKTCIIDNKIVFIGSANIAQCHLPNESWRDTSVKICGADTKQLVQAFEKVWGNNSINTKFKNLLKKPKFDSIFRLNNTFRKRYIHYRLLLRTLRNCKKRIWITNSYFVPDQKILNSLVKAAKRGIDVRIILPSISDIFASSLLAKTYYSILIESGVLIYEYLPKILHSKILIIDDIYYLGSSNLNFRSIKHDLEIDVNIQTQNAKSILENNFLNDIESSKKITTDDIKKQPFFYRLGGKILLFLRYWF